MDKVIDVPVDHTGKCKYCQEKCCNCRLCLKEKRNTPNICTKCFRRVSTIHEKV